MFANIASHGWDYNRHGVVATLKISPRDEDLSYYDAGNDATAYQRFLPASPLSGPIAILPLPNNFASLVWSTTPVTAAHLKSLPSESFIHIINAALWLDQNDTKYLLSLPNTTDPSVYEKELNWRLKAYFANTNIIQPTTNRRCSRRFCSILPSTLSVMQHHSPTLVLHL